MEQQACHWIDKRRPVPVSGTAGAWYEVDLTSYVQAQKAAEQTTIGIALKGGTDTPPYVSFASREAANAPQLVITP